MQKMMASDNVGPEDDGNALVSAGEGSWPESNKTWEYRYHPLRCSYDYIGLTEYAPLEAIDDNYEKIVVSLDDVKFPSRAGIRHIQAWELAPFLR